MSYDLKMNVDLDFTEFIKDDLLGQLVSMYKKGITKRQHWTILIEISGIR